MTIAKAPPPLFEAKICRPGDLAKRLNSLGRPLVFTNGVFDIVHRGHVDYLARARARGASLLVAVNSDASARALDKGADRPVNVLEDRVAVIAALEAVTLVTWFDQETPLELIVAVRPDVLVKGADWEGRENPGHKFIEARGGRMVFIPLQTGYSTTNTIERLNRRRDSN